MNVYVYGPRRKVLGCFPLPCALVRGDELTVAADVAPAAGHVIYVVRRVRWHFRPSGTSVEVHVVPRPKQ